MRAPLVPKKTPIIELDKVRKTWSSKKTVENESETRSLTLLRLQGLQTLLYIKTLGLPIVLTLLLSILEDEYYDTLSCFNVVDRRLVRSCLDFKENKHINVGGCDICRYETCNKKVQTYSLENEYLNKEHINSSLFKTCECERCLLNRLLFKLIMNKTARNSKKFINWQSFILNTVSKSNINYKFVQLVNIIINLLKHRWLFITSNCKCVNRAVALLKQVVACESKIKSYKRIIIRTNKWLTLWILKTYFQHSSNKANMIEAGKLGLTISINRFDFNSGYKFSTYAKWWVKHKMYKVLVFQKKTQTLRMKILGMPNFKNKRIASGIINLAKIGTYRTLSFDRIIGENYNLHAIMACSSSTAEIEHKTNVIRAFTVLSKLVSLTPREERILRLRGHVLHRREWSLAKIGREIGLSRERVRQIETHCIFKMRSLSNDIMGWNLY
ncbi:RNA polymerase sigma factor rpoD [Candidatus Hodgkinia cicadicola]|nr:RNA polymerase sigma factor rpoD [Candidatus Hodgkinia cicadicola]